MKERLLKLDKYHEAVTSKKQQRSELMINSSTGALNMKMTTRMKSVNESVEDRFKNIRLNKRARTSVTEIQAECQSNGLKKQPVAMVKDVNSFKDNCGESDLLEKSCRLAAVDEGWDSTVKRRRALGTVLARPIDDEGVPKRAIQNRVVDEGGSQQHDARNSRLNNRDDSYTTCPSPLTKKKALRTAQITHENWEKAMAKETLISQEKDIYGKPTSGQCAGQRPPKVARTRRSNLVSDVSDQDDCSPSIGTHNSPVFKFAPIGPQKFIVKLDNVQSQSEESVGGERRLKGKKVNNEVDGIRGQNIGPCVTLAKKNKESVHAGTPNGCKKNDSKPGRRLKRLSEHKGLSDNVPLENSSSPNFTRESDDDQEELLAAANNTPHQQTESFFKKHDVDLKAFNGSTPFYQRVLSALIIEDDSDIDGFQEDYARNIQTENSFSPSTSDTYRLNESEPRKRGRVENKRDSTFALHGQGLCLTKKSSSGNGSTNIVSIYEDVTIKSFTGCPYEQMCIDDKLLLELQSIGLCPDKMPDLEEKEDEMIHHEVDQRNTTHHQQEVKEKPCLKTRTLARCHKSKRSGRNCFNETPLKDLFSAPPVENEPEEPTPVESQPDPKLLSDEAVAINKPTSNRGKNKKLLLNNISTATRTTFSGDTKSKRTPRTATKPPRPPKPQPKQKTNQPPTSEGKFVNNPTAPPHGTNQSANNKRNIRFVSRDRTEVNDHTNPLPPLVELDPIDDELGVVGGPHDFDSLLNFNEEVPEMDLDFAEGLDIPMDDLTEVGMF